MLAGVSFAITYLYRAESAARRMRVGDLLFSFFQVSILAYNAQHINEGQRRELERLSRTESADRSTQPT